MFLRLSSTAALILISLSSFTQDSRPFTSSFIARMGTDTVIVETYTMVNNHLYGKAFVRVPEDYLSVFSIHFYPDGSIREFNVHAMDPLNSSIPLHSTGNFHYRLNMNCRNDTCTYFNSDPNVQGEQVIRHAADKMDFVGGWTPIISLIEWNTMRLARSEENYLPLNMINHSIGVYPIGVARKDPTTMIFGGPFLEYTRVNVANDGRIKGLDGTGTPWNYIVTSHDPIDIDQLSRRMSRTKGIGIPSPNEKIEHIIKGAPVTVTYGRPYKRGRQIFGGIVPYDSLWRTGAGGPTIITFSQDVRFKNLYLPKGNYSVYTVPRISDWLLIFNSDTKRWPTDPDRTKDLGQVIIKTRRSAETHEQFTIMIKETSKGGRIEFIWDDVIASADFEVIRSE